MLEGQQEQLQREVQDLREQVTKAGNQDSATGQRKLSAADPEWHEILEDLKRKEREKDEERKEAYSQLEVDK